MFSPKQRLKIPASAINQAWKGTCILHMGWVRVFPSPKALVRNWASEPAGSTRQAGKISQQNTASIDKLQWGHMCGVNVQSTEHSTESGL